MRMVAVLVAVDLPVAKLEDVVEVEVVMRQPHREQLQDWEIDQMHIIQFKDMVEVLLFLEQVAVAEEQAVLEVMPHRATVEQPQLLQ
jgi:hypothetical protein